MPEIEAKPDCKYLASVRTKQGRFNEARDYQMKLIDLLNFARFWQQKRSDQAQALDEMVDTWRGMGKNEKALQLQLRYVRRIPDMQIRSTGLERLTDSWSISNLHDSAARLQAESIEYYWPNKKLNAIGGFPVASIEAHKLEGPQGPREHRKFYHELVKVDK